MAPRQESFRTRLNAGHWRALSGGESPLGFLITKLSIGLRYPAASGNPGHKPLPALGGRGPLTDAGEPIVTHSCTVTIKGFIQFVVILYILCARHH